MQVSTLNRVLLDLQVSPVRLVLLVIQISHLSLVLLVSPLRLALPVHVELLRVLN